MRIVALAFFCLTVAFLLGATAGPAEAIRCGAVISSVVKTGPVSSTDGDWVNLPGATVIVDVPTAQQRCIKITFATFQINDSPSAGIRVLDRGTPFFVRTGFYHPDVDGGEEVTLLSAKRIGGGRHVIQVQYRGNAGGEGSFYLGPWTLDVELTY